MLRYLLYSRAIQAGCVFFLIVVGSSLFYFWQVQRMTEVEVEIARKQQMLAQFKSKRETRTRQDVRAPADTETLGKTETSLETDDTDTPRSAETDALPVDATETIDLTDAFLPDTSTAEEVAENVPVSPHGFGAYPEVPSDYFRTPVWAYPDAEFTRGHELIDRVLIKLWKQGISSDGGIIENGRVYPITRGTVYVKWKGDAISDYIGHPDDDDEQIISILEDKGTPTGITVLDYDTAGIDPYEFLDLP